MTFACLSQATATSKRVFHQTQNTFNRIHNTFITDEIHDQGKTIFQYCLDKKQNDMSHMTCFSRLIILLGLCNLNNDPTQYSLFSWSTGKGTTNEI